MKNNFYNKSIGNIYSKPSIKSELTSQILYGEKFKVISKNKNWVKIKTDYDKYVGYLKNSKFLSSFNPTYKISKLKSKIYKKKNIKFVPTNQYLFFSTKIEINKQENKFIKFDNNSWLMKNDLKRINHTNKNFSKILKLFLNTRYLWGGKSAKGIDCSALIQIFYYYNNIFFPRDTKEQVKFIRKLKNKQLYNKNKFLYWKGHVAAHMTKSSIIHAYGPKKKVLIMDKKKTIKEIKKNTNLNLIKL